MPAEERFLPLRIAARGDDGGFYRLVKRARARGHFGKFAHTDRLHGREGRIERPGSESCRFLDAAGGDHLAKPFGNARVQPGAGRRQNNLWRVGGQESPAGLPLPGEQRPSGRVDDLERAGEALGVARLETMRHFRIARPEGFMQLAGLRVSGHVTPPVPDFRWDLRHRGKASEKGTEIEARSADDYQGAVVLVGFLKHLADVVEPCRNGVVPCRIDMTVETVRRSDEVFRRGAGAQHVEVPIDLHAVRVHHERVMGLRLFQCQRRLAACRGPGYQQGLFSHPNVPVAGRRFAMSLVATLVSAPQTPQLDSDLAGRAAEALGDLAAGSVETRVLAEGLAVDLFFEARSDGMSREADTRLREIVSSAPVDVLVQKHEGRRKRLLIADMDSTLIEQECIDELAAAVGKKDVIAAITERAMRGELEFEGALRERAGMLAGLPETVIAEVLSNQITLTPGAKALVATMKAHGAYCALVSGGFTAFTAEIAATLGMDENRANTLEIESGRLTGRVGEPILGRAAKRQRLQELIAELGLDASGTMAVGDGANDLAMIELAGLGVAFHAKPAVAAAADARVDHGDLTALLYFQGYTASEIRNA